MTKFSMHIDIDKMYSKNYQMTFVIDRGFAEVQSQKIAPSLEPFGIF